MFSMQCRKTLELMITTKKRMNIDSYINISTNIYVTIMTQNKNDSINSILQHGGVVHKKCWVVFPPSGFPYLILCPRQCKWKVPETYLAIKTKNK